MDFSSVFNEPTYFPDVSAYDEESFDPKIALDENAKNIVFVIGDGEFVHLHAQAYKINFN